MNRKDRKTAQSQATGENLAAITSVIQKALQEATRLQQAGEKVIVRQIYTEILKLDPHCVTALNNLALQCIAEGQEEEALELYNRALMAAPDLAEVHNNKGLALKAQNRIDEAMASYRRALDLKPDYAEAHWNMAYIQLMKGDFIPGWRENEWRWKIGLLDDPALQAPLWRGEDLNGKTILLYCEQGLGDDIQFIRYAKMVKARRAKVILPCPAPLARIFRNVDGLDVINREGEEIPAHDFRAPLMSLPGVFNTTLETIPDHSPYLHADKADIEAWQKRLSQFAGKKIGIVWRGNPTHTNDRNRSMKPEQFAAMLKGFDGCVINLQKDAQVEDIQALGIEHHRFFNPGPNLNDFADTAALISNLDLVISVDTAMCHLAGAMGVAVWTLVPFAPDWRWLMDRTDTPWYPSMTLFRQKQVRDWMPVIDYVQKELSALKRKF